MAHALSLSDLAWVLVSNSSQIQIWTLKTRCLFNPLRRLERVCVQRKNDVCQDSCCFSSLRLTFVLFWAMKTLLNHLGPWPSDLKHSKSFQVSCTYRDIQRNDTRHEKRKMRVLHNHKIYYLGLYYHGLSAQSRPAVRKFLWENCGQVIIIFRARCVPFCTPLNKAGLKHRVITKFKIPQKSILSIIVKKGKGAEFTRRGQTTGFESFCHR